MKKMGQCRVMTHEFLCNEVPRNFQEYQIRDKMGVHGTQSSHQDPIQESGLFSGIQTNQDTCEDIGHRINSRFTLRSNEGRESSGDRGVNHIHHTSINPHTALISLLTIDSTSNNEENYEGLRTEVSTPRCIDADNSVFV